MLLLQKTALDIINKNIEGRFEDIVEAYQFINDYKLNYLLSDNQTADLDQLIEMGAVKTLPFSMLSA